MDNKTLRNMVGLLIVCFGLLALLNILPFGKGEISSAYVNIKEVQGIEIVHEGKPYTLNFEQQQKVIDYLNMAVLVKKEAYPIDKNGTDFDKIVIHPFDKSPITITPVRVSGKEDLVLDAPDWNKTNYLLDLSQGGLKHLITESFSK